MFPIVIFDLIVLTDWAALIEFVLFCLYWLYSIVVGLLFFISGQKYAWSGMISMILPPVCWFFWLIVTIGSQFSSMNLFSWYWMMLQSEPAAMTMALVSSAAAILLPAKQIYLLICAYKEQKAQLEKGQNSEQAF